MKKEELKESYFEGCISIEKVGDWTRVWRLPHKELKLFPLLEDISGNASGARLRFSTNSQNIALFCRKNDEIPENTPFLFDITIDGELIQSSKLDAEKQIVEFKNLPSGKKLLELWLPTAYKHEFGDLLIDDSATIEEETDSRKKWTNYGSSISHCNNAFSPSRTWPAIVSRRCGFNLTNLGFSGRCHIEPMVARAISDLPADFISLKLSANVLGAGSLSIRTYKPAVIGFLRTIRDKQPDCPIALISPIYLPDRESKLNAVEMTGIIMRKELEDAVDRFNSVYNDKNLYYFNGLDLFDESLSGDYQPDRCHPNAEGIEIMGENFIKKIIPSIKWNK